MKVRALVVGALPRAGFLSAKVLVGDIAEWRIVPLVTPKEIMLDGEVSIIYKRVGEKTDELERFPLRIATTLKNAEWVQAIFEKDISDASFISIILEET